MAWWVLGRLAMEDGFPAPAGVGGEPTLVPGSACGGAAWTPTLWARPSPPAGRWSPSGRWRTPGNREDAESRLPPCPSCPCTREALGPPHVRLQGSPRGWGWGRSCWAGSFPHSLSQASRACVPRGGPWTVLETGELEGPHPAGPGGGPARQLLPKTCATAHMFWPPRLLRCLKLQGLGSPCSLWSRDMGGGDSPPSPRPPQLRNCDFTFGFLCPEALSGGGRSQRVDSRGGIGIPRWAGTAADL